MEYYVIVKKFTSKNGKNCTIVYLEDGNGYNVSTIGWGDDLAKKFGASFGDLQEASNVGYKILGTFKTRE